jgi:hypothetical protein
MHTETNFAEGPRGDEAVYWLWKEWANVLRVRNDGIPILGFTWYSLTDQTDWDTCLRGGPATSARSGSTTSTATSGPWAGRTSGWWRTGPACCRPGARPWCCRSTGLPIFFPKNRTPLSPFALGFSRPLARRVAGRGVFFPKNRTPPAGLSVVTARPAAALRGPDPRLARRVRPPPPAPPPASASYQAGRPARPRAKRAAAACAGRFLAVPPARPAARGAGCPARP